MDLVSVLCKILSVVTLYGLIGLLLNTLKRYVGRGTLHSFTTRRCT